MGAFELLDQDGLPVPVPDDGYQGTFFPLPRGVPRGQWEEEHYARESHIDWVAAAIAFHAYPSELNYLPDTVRQRMDLHAHAFEYLAEHPTEIEERNAHAA